jgi:hypothetical protein
LEVWDGFVAGGTLFPLVMAAVATSGALLGSLELWSDGEGSEQRKTVRADPEFHLPYAVLGPQFRPQANLHHRNHTAADGKKLSERARKDRLG